MTIGTAAQTGSRTATTSIRFSVVGIPENGRLLLSVVEAV